METWRLFFENGISCWSVLVVDLSKGDGIKLSESDNYLDVNLCGNLCSGNRYLCVIEI